MRASIQASISLSTNTVDFVRFSLIAVLVRALFDVVLFLKFAI